MGDEELYQRHIQYIFDNFDRMMQERDRAFDHFFDDDFGDAEPTLKEYEAMQRRIMNLLNQGAGRNSGIGNMNSFEAGPNSYDVSREEKDGKLIYRINVPDLENKNLRIEVKDGLLRISEERKEQGESKLGQGTMQTFSYGQFQKVIPLPEGIDPASVQYKKEKEQIVVIFPKGRENS